MIFKGGGTDCHAKLWKLEKFSKQQGTGMSFIFLLEKTNFQFFMHTWEET